MKKSLNSIVIYLSVLLIIKCYGKHVYELRELTKEARYDHQPLLLIEEKDRSWLALPIMYDDRAHVAITPEQRLILACPSGNDSNDTNTFENDVPPIINVIKSKYPKFEANDLSPEWQLSHVECKNKNNISVRQTGIKCTKNPLNMGEIYEIGFYTYKGYGKIMSTIYNISKSILPNRSLKSINKKSLKWHKLITVCYNKYTASSLYTSHILHGASLQAGNRLTHRPTPIFEQQNIPYKNINHAYFYNKSQESEMSSNIDSDVVRVYHDKLSKYLIPLQLTPEDDMLFPIWKLTAYSYLNVVPVWLAIAAQNWKRVETAVRTFAEMAMVNLIIYTGVWDVLSVLNGLYRFEYLYLNKRNGQVPVPQYLLKLVYHPPTKKAIIFVTHNNPYYDNCEKKICSESFDDYGWSHIVSNNPDQGCTYSCSWNEISYFKEKRLPMITVESVLRYTDINKIRSTTGELSFTKNEDLIYG